MTATDPAVEASSGIRVEHPPIPRYVQIGERIYNYLVTWFPSHHVRQAFLRFFGARIGKNTSIMMGTTLMGLSRLVIGDCCSIGFRCLLDARGGIVIDDDVVLASDVHIVTAKHLANSPDFAVELDSVHIGHHAWITSRCTVLQGVDIGVGAVVGACSLVLSDVEDMTIVAGSPAKPIGKRDSTLEYHPVFRPILT